MYCEAGVVVSKLTRVYIYIHIYPHFTNIGKLPSTLGFRHLAMLEFPYTTQGVSIKGPTYMHTCTHSSKKKKGKEHSGYDVDVLIGTVIIKVSVSIVMVVLQ